jgi:SAM-dependent methyltransferase
MTEPLLQAQIDAAMAYEGLMVPSLFGEWASEVADAAQIRAGERVLDVACGTGILAREAASRTGATGSVIGVDPSPGMLVVAKRLAPKVEWQQGVAEWLPFADQTFDVVASQFGLMFFDDQRAALRQAWRVLRPGGRLAIVVWDALDNIPAYAEEVALLERLAGTPAADALRAPFVLGHRRDLLRLFADAGVGDVDVTTQKGRAKFSSVRVMVEADLRGWLPIMGVALTEAQITEILEAAEQALSRYVTSDGTASFETSAHVVMGTKP